MIVVHKFSNFFLIGVLAVMLHPQLFSQSSFYTVEGFYRDYDTVENFTSLIAENGFDETWEYRIELDWDIPIFDTTFNHLNATSDASYFTDESVDFTHLLMSCVFFFDQLTGPPIGNLQSDTRLMIDSSDRDNKVVIFEYRKARFATDTSIEEFDSFISFQHRFYQNGDVEIHFGPRNLDNSSSYIPGEGIFLTTPFDTFQQGEIGILNPNIEFNAIGIDGMGEEVALVPDDIGFMLTLPPEGFVYKFKYNDLTSGTNPIVDTKKSFLYPTICDDAVYLHLTDFSDCMVKIISLDGRVVLKRKSKGVQDVVRIDVANLNKGSYILYLISDEAKVSHKFFKK
ncbi:MAG: T9SS type A sorting domain-containing protein [Bacteroidetes bacterium]|jgi:hypothetical protein|nr:T9SS type A sorting domain-containing protein [Bacteroidota bacterium]